MITQLKNSANPPKPKVLMLLLEYKPVFTGHGIYLEQLIRKLRLLNCEVSILAADFYKFPHHELVDGIEVFRFPFSHQEKHYEFKLALRVINFLRHHHSDYNILHIHGHLDIYGLLTTYNRLMGKHTISQMVLLGADDPMTLRTIYKLMDIRLRILSMMDRFLCISKALQESCLRANLNPAKVTYIPQGVDIDRFKPVTTLREKKVLRNKLGLPLDVPIVTFIGAIVERKGVDWLVDAWVQVQKAHPQAYLVLVGQNEFDSLDVNQLELTRFVQGISAQIENDKLNVLMAGKKNNVEEYLKCADVFVLPSRKEGFGNVILEAMASGVPAVVTYMDGVAEETITHGENGYIAHSVAEIAGWISRLLEDKQLAVSLGAAGRQRAEERFAMEKIAASYMGVYQDILRS